MGNLTKEEKARRAALANSENNTAAGMDSNTQQPQTNTNGGELEKDAATQENADNGLTEGAGVITGTLSELPGNFVDLTTDQQLAEGNGQENNGIAANLNSTNTLNSEEQEPAREIEGILMTGEEVKKLQDAGVIDAEYKTLMEGPELFRHLDGVQIARIGDGVVNQEQIAASPLFTFADVQPGDNRMIILEKVTYKRKMDEEVTQEDLNNFPELGYSGVTLYHKKGEAVELLTKWAEANPDAIEAIRNGTYVPPSENNVPEGQENSQDEHVYHGDFLSEGQLGQNLKVTWDWNEVTAPDHVAQRPEISKKPEGGLPPIIEA